MKTLSLGGSELFWALEFCGKASRDVKRKGLSGSGGGDLSIYKQSSWGLWWACPSEKLAFTACVGKESAKYQALPVF